jgi:transcriptional regulator with XRE-family HTH domain
MEIGLRLRSLRKNREMSLEDLARRSGVALATLSRIENGKGSGTFRTHQKIADAMGVSLPELYRGLDKPEEVAVALPSEEEAETFTFDEKASAIFLVRGIRAKQMLPQLLVIQPGGKTALEQYREGTDRWLFGLEGSAQVQVGPKTYPVSEGGTLYFRGSLPHRLINSHHSKIAKVISVTSPVVL